MDYEEAMSFLEDTKQYGSRLGLGTIRALMHELGDVQERLPVIHIGGTNGKGSVGAMLSAVFTEAGYRVGWFNTPDVFSYEEEFRICGVPIARERLAQLFAEVREACVRLAAHPDEDGAAQEQAAAPTGPVRHPTRFEVECAAAFLWFYEEACDIALIEVGMGGETDATNVISHPLVSVLTSISRDHMKILGETLPQIARIKAGIIKPGCPVVTVPQDEAVMQVIKARCAECAAPLFVADAAPHSLFFAENAACAQKVLSVLRESEPARFPELTDAAAARGMASAYWPGRYEVARENPTVLLDGAHNEAAARRLREALDADYPGRKFCYIFGVLEEKEYDAMAQIMFRPGERVYTVTPNNPRALPAKELAAQLKRMHIDAVCCGIPEAVSCALREADAADVIVAFGSLYCLSEVREALHKTL